MKVSGSLNDWKVVDGAPVLKTQAEKDTENLNRKKAFWRKEAFSLADKVKRTFITERNGKVYEFTSYTQIRFLIQYNRQGDNDTVRVRVKNAPSVRLNKTNATLLFNLITAHEDATEDALENDLTAIEAGIFSLSNLKAIEAAQEALRDQ